LFARLRTRTHSQIPSPTSWLPQNHELAHPRTCRSELVREASDLIHRQIPSPTSWLPQNHDLAHLVPVGANVFARLRTGNIAKSPRQQVGSYRIMNWFTRSLWERTCSRGFGPDTPPDPSPTSWLLQNHELAHLVPVGANLFARLGPDIPPNPLANKLAPTESWF